MHHAIHVTLLLLAVVAAVAATSPPPPQYAYVVGGSTFDSLRVVRCSAPPADALSNFSILANATWVPSMNVTGWNVLRVTANPLRLAPASNENAERHRGGPGHALSNASLAYAAAGLLEGTLAAQQMVDTLANTFSYGPPPGPVQRWLATNHDFIANFLCNAANAVPANASAGAPGFVVQLCKTYQQLRGILRGVNEAQPRPWNMRPGGWDMVHLWMLNAQAEVMDIFVYCNISMMDATWRPSFQRLHNVDPLLQQHCSALVKVTEDDVVASHTTWAQFNMLIRVWKTTEFEETTQFSGYAGIVASVDDWYSMSRSRLQVLETTFTQGNAQLTQQFVTPWTVPYFLRVVVANAVATSGAEWATLFLTLNSGSYCNTWMVVDYKRVTVAPPSSSPRVSLGSGALWVVEQMPGPHSASGDMTDVLRTEGYYASYNIPRNKAVFAMSGNLAQQQLYGAFFSFNESARARIFRRDHHLVRDVVSMQALMRSNRFRSDPLSRIPGCSGCNPASNPTLAVAARGDLAALNPTFGNLSTYMQGFFGASAFGALDCKVGAHSLFTPSSSCRGGVCVTALAQQGPTTNDGLPPLRLSALPAAIAMTTVGQYSGAFSFPFIAFSTSGAAVVQDTAGAAASSGFRWDEYSIGGVALFAVVAVVLAVVAVNHHWRNNDDTNLLHHRVQ